MPERQRIAADVEYVAALERADAALLAALKAVPNLKASVVEPKEHVRVLTHALEDVRLNIVDVDARYKQ